MKKLINFVVLSLSFISLAQQIADSTTFKKRVLENIELSILSSFYTQDGKNASVTGGIGSEQLDDYATSIDVSIPVKQNVVLKIDGTISAYTSASSSNLNPWSGASYGDDDDDDDKYNGTKVITGTPWAESSEASRKDTWLNFTTSYSHYSEDRNTIFSGNASVSDEFDYFFFRHRC